MESESEDTGIFQQPKCQTPTNNSDSANTNNHINISAQLCMTNNLVDSATQMGSEFLNAAP
jgi:hypothetical protein